LKFQIAKFDEVLGLFDQATIDEVVDLFDKAPDPAVRGRREHWRQWVEYHLRTGPVLCAYYGDKLVGAGGCDIKRPGVGTPWVVLNGEIDILPNGKFPTAEAVKYLETAIGNLRTMMGLVCESYGLKKLHTDSYKDFPASQRLLKILGFRRLRRQTKERYFYVRDEKCLQQ